MTELTASQMREIDGGEGFWWGFACGAATSFALAMTLSPEPFSKIALGSAWTTATGSCGRALF